MISLNLLLVLYRNHIQARSGGPQALRLKKFNAVLAQIPYFDKKGRTRERKTLRHHTSIPSPSLPPPTRPKKTDRKRRNERKEKKTANHATPPGDPPLPPTPKNPLPHHQNNLNTPPPLLPPANHHHSIPAALHNEQTPPAPAAQPLQPGSRHRLLPQIPPILPGLARDANLPTHAPAGRSGIARGLGVVRRDFY